MSIFSQQYICRKIARISKCKTNTREQHNLSQQQTTTQPKEKGAQYVTLTNDTHNIADIQIHIVPTAHKYTNKAEKQLDYKVRNNLGDCEATLCSNPHNQTIYQNQVKEQNATEADAAEADKQPNDQHQLIKKAQVPQDKDKQCKWTLRARLSLLWIIWINGLGIIVGINMLEVYLHYLKFYSWSLTCCDWVSSFFNL